MRFFVIILLALSSVSAQEKTQEGNRRVWAVMDWIPYVRIQDPAVNQMCRQIQEKVGLSGKNDVIVFEPLVVDNRNVVSIKWVLIPGSGLPQVTVSGEDFAPILEKLGFFQYLLIRQGLCYPGNDSDTLHAELTTDTMAEARELAAALQ